MAASIIHMPPTGGCVDDQLAADTAYWFSACDTGAARTKVAQHSAAGVVDVVGVCEHPCAAASARLTAVDVMHSRADHRCPCAPL